MRWKVGILRVFWSLSGLWAALLTILAVNLLLDYRLRDDFPGANDEAQWFLLMAIVPVVVLRLILSLGFWCAEGFRGGGGDREIR
jgi:hypothetical protein